MPQGRHPAGFRLFDLLKGETTRDSLSGASPALTTALNNPRPVCGWETLPFISLAHPARKTHIHQTAELVRHVTRTVGFPNSLEFKAAGEDELFQETSSFDIHLIGRNRLSLDPLEVGFGFLLVDSSGEGIEATVFV